MEKTLILLKPDTLQRGLVGEIIGRFERAGLKIIGMKMVKPDEAHFHHHYETISKMITRRGEAQFKANLHFMSQSPVIAAVLEGVEAIGVVRKLVGNSVDPKEAPVGSIRGDYAHMSIEHANSKVIGIPNLVHASGNTEEAKLEIEHWFKKDELFSYKASHEHLTQT